MAVLSFPRNLHGAGEGPLLLPSPACQLATPFHSRPVQTLDSTEIQRGVGNDAIEVFERPFCTEQWETCAWRIPHCANLGDYN